MATDNLHGIYCRITINRKKSEFATGLRCRKEDWDDHKQRCTGKSNGKLNDGLLQLENQIMDERLSHQKSNKKLTAKTLKLILQGKHKTTYTLLEFARLYIKKRLEQEGEKVIIRQTANAVSYLEGFLRTKNKLDIQLEDFNQGELRDFNTYMRNISYGVYGRKFDPNTIHKYLSKIRAIFINAIQHELITRNPFAGYRIERQEKERMGLDFYQIKKLMQLDLSERPELETTRDCFLFCCFTGIRFGDSRIISPNDLLYDDFLKVHYLKFTPQKTMQCKSKKLAIPLVEGAMGIIQKYESHPLSVGNGKLLPTVSNQKTNKKLKEIQAILGWNDEPLTFHLSRHTLSACITNIGTSDIIKDSILGHANNSMSARYSRNIQLSTILISLKEIEQQILNS